MNEIQNMSNFHVKKRVVILSVSALVLAGVIAIALRLIETGPPLSENLERHWCVSYTIKFRPNGEAAVGWVAIPSSRENFQILTESFTHSQMEVSFHQNQGAHEREVHIFSPPQKKTVRFEAQFDILLNNGEATSPFIGETLSPEAVINYLRDGEGIQATSPVVLNILSEIGSKGDDPEKTLLRIFTYCRDIKGAAKREKGQTLDPVLSNAVDVIERKQGTVLGRARTMVALCRGASIPARVISGFLFIDDPVTQPHRWVEAHVNGKWRSYDPAFKVYHNLGNRYMPLQRDRTTIMELSEVRDRYVQCSVKRKAPPSKVSVTRDSRILAILDLTNLPPRLSDAVALILLLPLGGLVISIFSNIFGLKSFGYFIPALIGMSFVDVQWLPGISVFLVIVIIGLGSRVLFRKLNLNKMPQVSLVLLFVVLSLTITVSVLDLFNIRPSPRALLLPMISLTMMIEAFQKRTEESGYRSAFKKLGITLMVAFCCWLLFSIEEIQWTFLTFPESEFFVAAALVLVGSRKEANATSSIPSAQVSESAILETPHSIRQDPDV